MSNTPSVIQKQPAIPMKYWGDDVRGLSNFFIRCALFAVAGNRITEEEKEKRDAKIKLLMGETDEADEENILHIHREFHLNKAIRTDGTFNLTYTGYQLDQDILDIYMQLLHISRFKGDDGKWYFNQDPIQISLNKTLLGMENSTGGKNIKWLHDSIEILKKAEIKISSKNGEKVYSGNLIQNYWKDKETSKFLFTINPNLACLFDEKMFSRILVEHRVKLKGKDLALWLLNFYTSHKATLKKLYKVETIKEMCGSSCKELKVFRQNLKKALFELQKVTGWTCYIEDDLVTIIKPSSIKK